MTYTRIQHAYSPEQYSRAVELWRRLLDCHNVATYEVRYGYETHVETVPDETLFALIMSDGEETSQDYAVRVSLMSYSDNGGSDLDAANVRAIADHHAWVSTSTAQASGGGAAWLTLGELGDIDDTEEGLNLLESLVGAIERLSDYPLIDEEAHSAYVDELAEEAWDAFLSWTVNRELDDMCGRGGDFDDFGYTPDEIREMYYAYEGNEWTCQTATSVHNGRHDDAVKAIFEHALSEWRKPYVDPAQLVLIAV